MRLLNYNLFLLSVGLLFLSPAFPATQSVRIFVKNGNIYYLQSGKYYKQITNAARDHDPVLSSDGKMIAFIRKGKKIAPKECRQLANIDDKFGDEIWLYSFKSKKEKLLVENNFSCDKPEEEIVDPSSLKFSPDNKTIYFLTSAWVTSSALHKVNIDGTHQQYLMPANLFYVVLSGRHRGDLIVQQHHYLANAGSVEESSFFSPQGRALASLYKSL